MTLSWSLRLQRRTTRFFVFTDAGPVVAAVDFSETSTHAAHLAAELAQNLRLRSILLHVVAPLRTVMRWHHHAAAHDRTRIAEALHKLELLASSLATTTATETQVVAGDPAEEIAAAATRVNASLIVMGLRGKGGLMTPAPGSIAYRILCLASMPVLAIS